jgi:uncharacterized membrane protein
MIILRNSFMIERKVIIPLLIISAALNLIFIGGISYRVKNIEESMPRPFPPTMDWAIRDLSPERREEIRNEIGSTALNTTSEMVLLRSGVAQAQRRVNELMTSENYSEDNLNEALQQLREAESNFQETSHQRTVQWFSRMDLEERIAARSFIERRGARGARNSPQGDRPGGAGIRGPRDPRGRPISERPGDQ